MEAGLTKPLSEMLKEQYLEQNKNVGINKLTKKQQEIVNTMATEEIGAYNNYREYIQARQQYGIGGKVYKADISKDDITKKRPVTFKESALKKMAERDIRSEYLKYGATKVNPILSKTSQRRYNTGVINRLNLPTTIIDKKAIESVPRTEKLKAKVDKYIMGINELILVRLYPGLEILQYSSLMTHRPHPSQNIVQPQFFPNCHLYREMEIGL